LLIGRRMGWIGEGEAKAVEDVWQQEERMISTKEEAEERSELAQLRTLSARSTWPP
jgi:hypothetical protein